MPDLRYRVLAIASHPVQYMAPIFRRLAQHPTLDLQVIYCSLRGAEAAHDPEFGADIQWDVPLLDGYSWMLLTNNGRQKESADGSSYLRLWKLIRRGNFDAILCFTGYRHAVFWLGLTAAKLSRTAFLFGTDATTIAPRDGRAWKTWLKKTLWPHLFALADQAIAPSSGTRDMMLSLGIPSDRITLTPYTVDNAWWMLQSSRVDRTAIRDAWGAGENTTVVLFCAKLQPWKRPADLLHAFAKANLTDTLLVFAGEGPLRSQLESEAVRLGINSRVRFLGFVNQSQLPSVYASADLMVLPSEYEPFAVVVNEAMCCRCPVMTSDRVGAARDLVAPVSPEFVFPFGDVDALTHLLKKAAGDRAHLRLAGEAALAHIQTWSPAANVAATFEAIELAVSRANSHGSHKPTIPPTPAYRGT